MGLEFEIERPISTAFRRAEIKKRQTSDGRFEASFSSDITDKVKSWGSVNAQTDSIRLNKFNHQGLSLRVLNDDGSFNVETDQSSIWNGFLTRYRSLLRIQAGYEDDDGNELPTDSTIGIYVMDNEIVTDGETLETVIQASSLKSIFDEVQADDVAGLGVTLSAGAIISTIRDHTDGAGIAIFREFITSTA